MEIIKRGNKPKYKVMFTCVMCGCVYNASNYEVREYKNNMDGQRFSCGCPECGYLNYSSIKLEVK